MGKPNDDNSTVGGEKQKLRRTFSVSKGFSDVHTILDELPGYESSRFICEAIRFYYQYKNNPNWVGEQLNSVLNLTTQLQHAMAELGKNSSFIPVQQPTTTTTLDQTNPTGIVHTSSPKISQETQVDTTSTAYKEDSSIKSPESNVGVGLAVEPENRFRTSSSTNPPDIPTNESGEKKPRRKSAMASSLVSKSMGVKQE